MFSLVSFPQKQFTYKNDQWNFDNYLRAIFLTNENEILVTKRKRQSEIYDLKSLTLFNENLIPQYSFLFFRG